MPSDRPVLINDVAVFDGRNPPVRSSVLVRRGVIAHVGERLVVGPARRSTGAPLGVRGVMTL